MLTQDRLKELLTYDCTTGEWTWNKSRPGCSRGSKAGCVSKSTKRRSIKIGGKIYLCSRLAFLNMEGYIPDIVDHIDRNPSNDKWSNLRLADVSKNKMNSKIHCNNTSGCKGVSFYKKTGKWMAFIQIDGKQIHLGLFDNIVDAVSARKNAEEKLHGEYRVI